MTGPASIITTTTTTTSGKKTLWPTRKWWAMLITSVGAFVATWINAGHFSKEIAVVLVGLLVQAVVTYLVPNHDTPGGLPPTNPAVTTTKQA
jgi:hypothetical protein